MKQFLIYVVSNHIFSVINSFNNGIGIVKHNIYTPLKASYKEENDVPFFMSIFNSPVRDKGSKTVTTRVPLGNLFDSREYVFNCVRNMRSYEWKLKEVDGLLDDLIDSSMGKFYSNKDYELNQIILVPAEWDQERYGLGCRYDVVDGQQRLVTLCLIFAALRECFRGEKDMEDTVTELSNMLNPPKTRKDDILRIELRESDDAVLNNILKGELDDEKSVKEMNIANRRIFENYKHVLSILKPLSEEERVKFLDYILIHVHMLVCVPESPMIARNIVMSQGKGMDIEPIDEFKGLVCFRYTEEEIKGYEIFDEWDNLASKTDLENDTVGRDIVSNACLLRASAALRSKIRKNDQTQVLELWLRQDIIQKKYDGKQFFLQNVKKSSLALANFRFGYYIFLLDIDRSNLVKTISMRLNFLRQLVSTVSQTKDIEMILLELILRAEDNDISLEKLDHYLHQAEYLSLWIIFFKPTSAQRLGRCFALLDSIFTSNIFEVISLEEKSSLKDEIISFQYGLTSSGKYIATGILERLNSYLLVKNNKELPQSSKLNVEQILPLQAKAWEDEWNESEKDAWVNRLANLALLSNKPTLKQSRMPFAGKKTRYQQEIWPLSHDLANMNVWNSNSAAERYGVVINLIQTIWHL